MENIVKGSKIAVLVILSGLPDEMEFTDGDVDVTLSFYINGKRSEKEVVITKEDLVATSVSSQFWALVDTTGLPLGNMMCEGSISYPFEGTDDKVVDKPYIEVGVSIIENS